MKLSSSIVNCSILALATALPTLYLATPLIATAESSRNNNEFLRSAKINRIASVPPTIQLLNGTWEGTYLCQQGLTRLKLVIKAKNLKNVDATFTFSAHASNPTVPSGSFKMKGIYTEMGSVDVPDTLELKATNWISQPSGYVTVDLQGNISPSEKRMVGNILNAPNCTTFDLVKVRS
jgi:hypothetical protein